MARPASAAPSICGAKVGRDQDLFVAGQWSSAAPNRSDLRATATARRRRRPATAWPPRRRSSANCSVKRYVFTRTMAARKDGRQAAARSEPDRRLAAPNRTGFAEHGQRQRAAAPCRTSTSVARRDECALGASRDRERDDWHAAATCTRYSARSRRRAAGFERGRPRRRASRPPLCGCRPARRP